MAEGRKDSLIVIDLRVLDMARFIKLKLKISSWARSGRKSFQKIKFKKGVSNDQEGDECAFMESNPSNRGGRNSRPDAFGGL